MIRNPIQNWIRFSHAEHGRARMGSALRLQMVYFDPLCGNNGDRLIELGARKFLELYRTGNQASLTDIHRMTGLLGLRVAQFWAGCKTGPWQTASTVCHDRNFYSLLSGNVDFAVIVR
jgi:hypothetical protein